MYLYVETGVCTFSVPLFTFVNCLKLMHVLLPFETFFLFLCLNSFLIYECCMLVIVLPRKFVRLLEYKVEGSGSVS